MGVGQWLLAGCVIVIGAAVLLRASRWHHRLVDVTARKPVGWWGRRLFSNPKPHSRSFQHVLERLGLTTDDVLLHVCCGGGPPGRARG